MHINLIFENLFTVCCFLYFLHLFPFLPELIRLIIIYTNNIKITR
nr:MAG TPA: hypothetical protein [Bacteriophage sp.]